MLPPWGSDLTPSVRRADGHRQIALDDVAADIRRPGAKDVVAGPQSTRIPEPLGGRALVQSIRHDVEIPGASAAVEGNAAAGSVHRARGIRVESNPIEPQRRASLLEAGRWRSVLLQNLVPQLVRRKTTRWCVVIRLVPGIDHHAHAAGDEQPIVHARRLQAPRFVVDANPVGATVSSKRTRRKRSGLCSSPAQPTFICTWLNRFTVPIRSPVAKRAPRLT